MVNYVCMYVILINEILRGKNSKSSRIVHVLSGRIVAIKSLTNVCTIFKIFSSGFFATETLKITTQLQYLQRPGPYVRLGLLSKKAKKSCDNCRMMNPFYRDPLCIFLCWLIRQDCVSCPSSDLSNIKSRKKYLSACSSQKHSSKNIESK